MLDPIRRSLLALAGLVAYLLYLGGNVVRQK